MKRFVCTTFALAILVAFGSLTATAQSRYTDAGATSKLSAGLGASIGFVVPTGDFTGADPALGIGYRVGLNTTAPFTDEVSGMLNLGIDGRSFSVSPEGSNDVYATNVQYFFVQPGFSYSSLGLSVNLGFPIGASATNPINTDETIDLETDQFEMMLEPRLNATLVLMDEEAYWLGLDISFGLMVNKLVKEEFQIDGTIAEASAFTGHLGLTWQFGLVDM